MAAMAVHRTQPTSRIILGIDPGLSMTGWGVISGDQSRLSLISYGCIRTKPSQPLVDRLMEIHRTIRTLIQTHHPDTVAIEELFFSKEARTIAAVGHSRGTILTAIALENTSVCEYNPRQVKMALTGYGSADKNQIQQMVKILLRLKEIPKPDDAADALAMAICHVHSQKFKTLCGASA